MNETTVKKTSPFAPVRSEWLAQRAEEILDPDLEIIDAHHHLWDRSECPYLVPDLRRDALSGHNVRGTIFVECRTRYRREGDRALRSLGETEFAAMSGAEADRSPGTSRGLCAGIVAFIDLQEGGATVDSLVDAHARAACGRLRGIRNMSAWDSHTAAAGAKGPPQGLLTAPTFREGFACLAPHGLTFDAWMFYTQLAELRDLADAFPDTPIVLNHVGGPVDTGGNLVHRDDIFRRWKGAMRTLASCPNVYVKLGGMGMPIFGFGFHELPLPPSAEELAHAWRPYIETCVQEFGSTRCMFESNFPVDKCSCSYATLWNAFKRITSGCSKQERHQLFCATASTFYRLTL
jgi:predicted TIM-barrel fold metal-dependent hydrolase